MSCAIFCKFYNGLMGNVECLAGVPYESVIAGKGTQQMTLPCVIQARPKNRLPTHCDKRKLPTIEELEAEDREHEKRFADLDKARKAIVAHLGGPWKRGMAGSSGCINCPVCGGVKTLRFSRAGYNGHIHARCNSYKCVAWIE